MGDVIDFEIYRKKCRGGDAEDRDRMARLKQRQGELDSASSLAKPKESPGEPVEQPAD